MPVKTGIGRPAEQPGQFQVVEPGQVGHRPAAPDDDQGVEGPLPVGGEGLVDGGADRGRGVEPLEGRPEEEEVAEPGVLEPVGLPAEVAQARRGLGADDGDPDELDRGGEALVPVVEAVPDEPLPDAGQLGGEVAQGVGRVHVLDDQVEAVEGVEPDPGQAEDLDVGLEPLAGRLARTWR